MAKKGEIIAQQKPTLLVHNVWTVLTVLTLSRICVSFQFQSITTSFDYLQQSLSFTTTGFGILLGLYMAPGALVAISAPSLVKKYGIVYVLLGSLALMAIGQVSLIWSSSLLFAYGSRLLAGIGGCLIYVLTIDVAAKQCDAGRIPGRMATIAASWPFGNAFSLVLLGTLVSLDLELAALYIPAILSVLAALLIVWKVPDATDIHKSNTTLAGWRKVLSTSLTPGLVFALYNVSFILITSFSPQLLVSQGYTANVASNIASLPMWIFVLSVPIGGLIANNSSFSGRLLVGLGCLGPALCMVISFYSSDKTIWYVLMGVLGGLPTGPMLTHNESESSGLFYSSLFFVFFITLLICPPLVGLAIEATGDNRSTIVFCVLLLIVPFLLYIKQNRVNTSSANNST